MSLNISENNRCKILHRETIEIIESLEQLGHRFSNSNHDVTEREAQQSIEYLRCDLTRLEQDVTSIQTSNSSAEQLVAKESGSTALPLILGGLFMGVVVEKS
jgi:hypothetical protein